MATLPSSALLALVAIFGQDYATAMTANLPFAKEAALFVLGAAGASGGTGDEDEAVLVAPHHVAGVVPAVD